MSKITLAAARVNAGYTITDIAKITGRSVSTISFWENGITFPKVDEAQKLTELYGVKLDDIIWKGEEK